MTLGESLTFGQLSFPTCTTRGLDHHMIVTGPWVLTGWGSRAAAARKEMICSTTYFLKQTVLSPHLWAMPSLVHRASPVSPERMRKPTLLCAPPQAPTVPAGCVCLTNPFPQHSFLRETGGPVRNPLCPQEFPPGSLRKPEKG